MSIEGFTRRIATAADIPAVKALMEVAIDRHFEALLSPAQIELSKSIMGLDTRLIEDGCYLLILEEDTGALAGCGGWSRRATLFGGDHTLAQRNDNLLDPAVDAARIRAMYTHPAFARRGLGRMILDECEKAAREAGFARVELMATPSGRPFYEACGYIEQEEIVAAQGEGIAVPGWKMWKPL